MSAGRVTALPRSPRGDVQQPAEHGSAEAAAVGEDVVRAPAPNPPQRPRTERPLPELPAQPDNRDRPQDHQPGRKAGRGLVRRRPLASATGLVLVILALTAAFFYWDNSRHFESTDDAFVAARRFSVAPKVSGYIAAVPVADNQHVGRGDVIARIDDRDYRVAVVQAQAQVAGAQASIENIDAQLKQQQAQIVADQAKVDQAQATLAFAQQQATRYQDLAKTGAGTIQNALVAIPLALALAT